MRPFEKLGLDSSIVDALAKVGIIDPTPIQEEAIPLVIEGKDIIGRARTGSGKTAAFGLPILQSVEGRGVFGLILCPTRELAIQVTNELQKYNSDPSVRLLTVYGGASFSDQERALRKGVSIVVGTPGRVIDHLKRKTLNVSEVRFAVLDEADEMLKMGFLEDVDTILNYTNKDRQTLLFSATMPKQIQRVANKHLTDPVVVQVESENLTTDHIEQFYLVVPFRKKMDALVSMLAGTDRGACLVFCRTKKTCGAVSDELAKRGFATDALHGDLNQGARERTLNRLRSKQLDIVVATDVAARGIDVDHLTHVFNFDLTRDAETYVHRIGRTGRAGRKGTAITFVTPSERRLWKDITRALKISPEETQMPSRKEVAQIQKKALEQKMFADTNFEKRQESTEWLARMVESGMEVDDIAIAALSQLSTYVEFDISKSDVDLTGNRDSGRSRDRDRDRGRDRKRDRGDRGGRGDRGRDPKRHDGPRKPRRPVSGDKEALNQVEIYIEVGRRDRIRPNDIVGAIANQADIKGTSIGRIDIGTDGSWVGLPRDVAAHILKNHSEIEIKGQPTEITISRDMVIGDDSGGDSKRPHRGASQQKTRKSQKRDRDVSATNDAPKRNSDKPQGDTLGNSTDESPKPTGKPKQAKLSKKAKAKKRGAETRKSFAPKAKSDSEPKKAQGKLTGKSFYKKKTTDAPKKRFPKFVKDNSK